MLKSVIAVEFADSNLTTNVIARQDCRESRQRLESAMLTIGGTNPRIWAGRSDADNDNGAVNLHHGETDDFGTRFHVDPGVLDSASFATTTRTKWRRVLAALLLHEASHLDPWLYQHPNADNRIAQGFIVDSPAKVAELYLQDRPFAVIHTQLDGAQCVKPI